LAEGVLALGREVRGWLEGEAWRDPVEEVEEGGGGGSMEGKKRFVGSIWEGGGGVGGWQWYFEMETKRNHRGELVG
jgi:hypothetical protein